MKSKIYIETSIPSFYYEIRTEPDMIARKEWTRFWWNTVDLSEIYNGKMVER
ncbi:hypothetical protein [Sphaerospermopsis reniformis]|uniref:hypothetical protein n=1 Tax=Sphaerospermopsis reniformis TaxID=531300 RepID=UPI001396841D|nr:hypothetical protein [Sphaerospermopsis reniformis]